MDKESINKLIAKSNLEETDYHLYNPSTNLIGRNEINENYAKFNKISVATFSNYVCIDFRSIDFADGNCVVIEICLIEVKNHKIEKIKQIFIKPDKSIPDFIRKKYNIENENPENYLELHFAVEGIIEFVSNNIIVIYDTSLNSRKFSKICESMNLHISNLVFNIADRIKIIFPDLKKYSLHYIKKELYITEKSESKIKANAIAIQILYELILKSGFWAEIYWNNIN